MKKYPTKLKDKTETVLRDKTDTIAVLAADLHFSHKPPPARSTEPDWYQAQTNYIRQLRQLSLSAPVIVAGDIFDRWNAPAELINMLLKELPQIYAVCGNHDLCNHDYSQLHRTAYGTLVEAGKIINVEPGKPVDVAGWHPFRLYGFPYGFPISPLEKGNGLVTEIAVLHAYVWTDKSGGYPGAPEDQKGAAIKEKGKGFDVILTGDNHSQISMTTKPPLLYNPGGFLRRRMDERHFASRVGLLKVRESGELYIESHYLDVSSDVFTDEDTAETLKQEGMEDLLQELNDLTDTAIDFESRLRQVMKSMSVPILVKRAITNALEGK